MSEVNKNKYLDLAGLKKYDELIKAFIATGNSALADAIAALDAKLGSLDVEGSDDKSIADSILDIYASIADIIAVQESLEAKDNDLAVQIKKVADDLDFITGSSSDNEATLGEINATLVDLQGELNLVKESLDAAAAAADEAKADAAQAKADAAQAMTDAAAAAVDANEAKDDAAAAATSAAAAEGAAADAQANAAAAAADAQTAAASAAQAQTDASDAKSAAEGAVAVADEANAAATEAAAAAVKAKDDAAAAVVVADEAKAAVDVLVGEGDGSVKKIAEAAAAEAVAAVVAEADSDFDTLKEVADWIAADTLGSAALQVSVSKNTEDITKLDAKVNADITNLTNHLTDYANALGDVDSRLDALETIGEIADSDIESLFA